MANLLSLPPELLIEISGYLPLAAQAAFKLTCPQIYHGTLPLRLDKTRVDLCTQLCINYYLAFDHYHHLCAICKQWYPYAMFADPLPTQTVEEDNRDAEAILRRGFDDIGGPGMLATPPGACAWHKSRLYRIIDCTDSTFMSVFATIPVLKNFRSSYKWISTVEKLCYHCGQIKGWRKCGCACETCGVKSVRTYTRLVRHQSDVERFVFFRRNGETWAREWTGRLCVDMKVENLD